MLDLFVWTLILCVSLALLIKSSDFFTEAARKVGIVSGLSPFVVGVAIVAIGTSLPELASAVSAVLKGSSEIVVGNVVGSNISNIFLVVGFAAVLAHSITIKYKLGRVDMPVLIGSALLLAVTLWDGMFNVLDAVFVLAGLGMYIYYITQQKEMPTRESREAYRFWPNVFVLFVCGLFIYLGATYTIDAVIRLSELLGVGEEVIAITAVALGTSLPELLVSIQAIRKKAPEMAIGNIIGSNIFNTFAITGIPALIGPLTVPSSILEFGLPLMLIATVLFYVVVQSKEITRWEGIMFLIFYCFFIVKSIGL